MDFQITTAIFRQAYLLRVLYLHLTGGKRNVMKINLFVCLPHVLSPVRGDDIIEAWQLTVLRCNIISFKKK